MRVATQCEQCGQTDDHPKVHIGEVTKHNDCLSFGEREQVVGSSELAEKVVVACENGKRGDELLNHIQSLHKKVGK